MNVIVCYFTYNDFTLLKENGVCKILNGSYVGVPIDQLRKKLLNKNTAANNS